MLRNDFMSFIERSFYELNRQANFQAGRYCHSNLALAERGYFPAVQVLCFQDRQFTKIQPTRLPKTEKWWQKSSAGDRRMTLSCLALNASSLGHSYWRRSRQPISTSDVTGREGGAPRGAIPAKRNREDVKTKGCWLVKKGEIHARSASTGLPPALRSSRWAFLLQNFGIHFRAKLYANRARNLAPAYRGSTIKDSMRG